MKTRSAVKKSSPSKQEVTTPLPPKKRKMESDEIHEAEAEITSEINLGNCQPVFNIHVHVPPMTNDSKKSPVIHLHFGDLVKRLSDLTSHVTESSDKNLKVKSPSNYENQRSKAPKKIVVKTGKRKRTYKKPRGSTAQKNFKNLKTEKTEGHIKSNRKTKEHKERPRNELSQKQLPARRSIRLEHNRILTNTLKEMKGSTSTITNSISRNPVKSMENDCETGSSGNSSSLKQAVVVLEDILKTQKSAVKEDIDEVTSEKPKDFNSETSEGASNNNSLEKVKEQTCDSSQECEKEISVLSEEDIDFVSNHEEVYSILHSSENTVNTKDGITNVLNKYHNDSNIDKNDNSDSKKRLNSDSSESYVEIGDNSQVQESTVVMSEENDCTNTEISNDATDVEKDNHQPASVRKPDINFEEKKVLDDYHDACVNSPVFQSNLIRQEMKKKHVQKGQSKKEARKNFKKKTLNQIAKEVSQKSSPLKKERVSSQIEKLSSAKNVEKVFSGEDFIPLKVSGPTKFAVAKINDIRPYNTHTAKNFKQEMLFRETVRRHSNPKQLQVNRLKKEAAKKRTK